MHATMFPLWEPRMTCRYMRRDRRVLNYFGGHIKCHTEEPFGVLGRWNTCCISSVCSRYPTRGISTVEITHRLQGNPRIRQFRTLWRICNFVGRSDEKLIPLLITACTQSHRDLYINMSVFVKASVRSSINQLSTLVAVNSNSNWYIVFETFCH